MKLSQKFLILFSFSYSLTLFVFGFNEESVTLAIRITARISLVLFLLTFIASPTHYLLKSTFSKMLLKNRSEIGISFAFSHLFHLAFILSYASLNMPALMDGRDILILSFGGITYVFIISMMLTSYPNFRKKLSASSWKRLHTIGSWFIFVVFTNSYLGNVIRGDMNYLPFAIIIVLAFVLRIAFLLSKRKTAK